MVAAPQRGQMLFEETVIGIDLGGGKYQLEDGSVVQAERITKEVYISDVAGAQITFDGGAGAGASSPVKFTLPFDAKMKDISVVTGLTDTTRMQVTRNGTPTGDIIRWGVHLTTLNNRPDPSIIYLAGDEVGGIQLA